jgi:succinyl-diaminopimelate desuccinylase
VEWDQGNEFFTPTSFQIYHINADTGASNIIPGALSASFNFRYAPSSNIEDLKQKTHKVFDDHQLNYEIIWKHTSESFLSPQGKLLATCKETIQEICKIETHTNTTGGTSDGRFIYKLGCELVELGPSSSSIHQVNENIKIADLTLLTQLYFRILQKLLPL